MRNLYILTSYHFLYSAAKVAQSSQTHIKREKIEIACNFTFFTDVCIQLLNVRLEGCIREIRICLSSAPWICAIHNSKALYFVTRLLVFLSVAYVFQWTSLVRIGILPVVQVPNFDCFATITISFAFFGSVCSAMTKQTLSRLSSLHNLRLEHIISKTEKCPKICCHYRCSRHKIEEQSLSLLAPITSILSYSICIWVSIGSLQLVTVGIIISGKLTYCNRQSRLPLLLFFFTVEYEV